jgi:membrane fusion protein (multidrug efflux system)
MLPSLTIQKAVVFYSLFSLLLIACDSNKGKTEKEAATPVADASKLPVDVVIVREQELDQEEVVTGTMIPYREVSIVSEIPQKIIQVAFNDGGYVSQGQLLYKLNDADIKARLKQLSAELKLARLNEERLGRLLKTETVRQQEYDEAAMKLQSLEAQEDLLQVELNKTVIRAPFSGKIGISKVDPGAYVSPGTELVSLQNQGSIKINFSVPEKYLPQVKVGKKISFTTELSDQQYSATIRATEPGVNAQNRSLQVQAIADNPGGKFRAGQSAKIYFRTAGKEAKAMTLPTEALIPGGQGYSVFVIKNGAAKSTPVSIGNRTETEAIITSGLTNGDSVIVSNILRAGEGMPVQVIASR